MATTDIETEKSKLKWSGFVLSAIGVFFFTWLYWFVASNFIPELEDRGQFGDMFGGLTSLFTGFAFAGLIYTILIQRQELQYQREELSLQRKEMARFADAQESSEKALSRQAEYLELSARVNTLGNLIAQRETISRYTRGDQFFSSQFENLLKDGSRAFIKSGNRINKSRQKHLTDYGVIQGIPIFLAGNS